MTTSRDQVIRMLALVPYLQGRDGIPVKEVAAEFGVSAKQIRDDLRLLMYVGPGQLPGELIDFDLGALEHDGVIHIRDAEFMTRPLRLNAREAVALIVALRTLRASTSGAQTSVIDGALSKLESAMGQDVTAAVDVHVDRVDPQIHTAVEQAVTHGKRLAISYATASRDDRTDRQVDPRRLFTSQGRLYLEAWCLTAQDLRFFRLDRMLTAEVTPHDAEQHDVEPRDLAAGLFTVGADAPYAVLDLQPHAHWLTDYYQVDVVEIHGDVRRVKMFGADWSWLRRLVLRNAGSISVVEPAFLADEVHRHAVAALAAYDGDDTPSKE